MVAQTAKVLIYAGSTEIFNKIAKILNETLEKDKYVLEELKLSADQIDFSPHLSDNSVSVLLLNNNNKLFSAEKTQKALHDFVFASNPAVNNGRKILVFCPNLLTDSKNDLQLLTYSFSEKNDAVSNVIDLFQKVIRGQDIPVNRQFVQLSVDPQKMTSSISSTGDDEFTVAVCKVDNSTSYLDVSNETGSEMVFVADSMEKLMEKSQKVWSSLAQTVLDIPCTFDLPEKQQISASIDTILVYTGHLLEKIDPNLSAKLDSLAEHISVRFHYLTGQKLHSTDTNAANLLKTSKAIILAPANSKDEFDPNIQLHLLEYYRRGGKILFLADPQQDTGLFWMLESIIKDKNLLKDVEQAFGKFATGHRVPENLQCTQVSGPENFALAMITVDGNLPLLYLANQDAGVLAYGAVQLERVFQKQTPAWKDLLRVLGVGGTLPGQDARFSQGRVVNRVKDDVIKSKPPNLFVYTPEKNQFDPYALAFRRTLHRDTYVVYHLSPENANRVPWAPYCRVLFLAESVKFTNLESKEKLVQYLKQTDGGRVVVFVDEKSYKNDPDIFWLLKSLMDDDEKSANEFIDRFRRFVDTNALPSNLITKQRNKDDKNAAEYYAAFLRVENAASLLFVAPDSQRALVYVCNYDAAKLFGADPLDSDEVWRDILRVVDLDVTTSLPSPLTSGYLYYKNEAALSKTCLSLKAVTSEQTPEMLFIRVDASDAQSPTFPVRVNQKRPDFDAEKFYQSLTTKFLGEAIIFIPVARSLMHFTASLANMTETVGMVTIAREQISPPKETGKTWISPAGAATFSFCLKISANSNLGQKIGFVKCLATLACYNGVVATEEYSQISKTTHFDLGIKWPDDLYYAKSYKIGGVLAKVVKTGDSFTIFYGFNINVDNKRPTACLNDFLDEKGPKFQIESVIASILNEFEKLIDFCQQKGTSALVPLFNERYVHVNREVKLVKTGELATIVGIADDGNLVVKMKSDGKEIKVNSDPTVELCSNSLDCLVKISA